ncbi:MAG: HAD-IA family hydrolase [Acidobacteriota bacterium]
MKSSRADGFELFIFDWDGTVVDSLAKIVACTQAALRKVGLPEADEEKIRRGIGLGLRQTVEAFCPACTDDTFDAIVAAYRELWFSDFTTQPDVFPGVREALAELSGRGHRLAVATAKGRRGLDRELEASGLAALFIASRTVDEALAKPNPQMVLDLMEETGARAENTVMIGDTPHDLLMAANARTAAIGVTTGTYESPELEQYQPVVVLNGVADLVPWIDRDPTTPRSLR